MMSTSLSFGNVGGDVSGNVAGHNVTVQQTPLEAMIQAQPSEQQAAIEAAVAELKEAIEAQEPDGMTIKEAFGKVTTLSKDVAEVAWTTWKNPLTGLGLAWEKLMGKPNEKK
jgi:hypothetical protein